MGAYNRLIARSLEPCPRCGHEGDIRIQFKWGQCYLHNYRVGEPLIWSDGAEDRPIKGPVDKGNPDDAVTLDAIAEPCPTCGFETDHEYEITVANNRITGYRFAGWS